MAYFDANEERNFDACCDTVAGVERYKAEEIKEEILDMKNKICDILNSLTDEEFENSSMSKFLQGIENQLVKVFDVMKKRG